MMSRIYLVHPEYGNLRFFRPLISNLKYRYKSNFRYFKLYTNDRSHEMCLSQLKKAKNAFVIFLCHGEEKNLRGCNRNSLNNKSYHRGTLISPSKNISVFEENKIFCLACKSKTLGGYAIKAGAKVYIGFDEVPFSLNGKMIGKRAFRQIKFELRSAVYDSLLSAIENNYSFNCRFRPKPATDSGLNLPLIPGETCHPFRK